MSTPNTYIHNFTDPDSSTEGFAPGRASKAIRDKARETMIERSRNEREAMRLRMLQLERERVSRRRWGGVAFILLCLSAVLSILGAWHLLA